MNRKCKNCNKLLPEDVHWNQKYCNDCQHSHCIDCGKEIAISSTRCISCAVKEVHKQSPRTGENSPVWIDLDLEEVRRLYMEENQSSMQIAKKMGCSEVTILDRLHKMEVPIRPVRFDLDIEQIKSLYAEGWSSPMIGEKLGCDPQVVINRLREAGIEIRKTSLKVMSLDMEFIKKLYANGKSVRGIAAGFGVAPSTIKNRLEAMGIRIRQFSEGIGRIPLDVEKIKQLYINGKSSTEIGELFRVSRKTILNRLHDMGVSCAPRIEIDMEYVKTAYLAGKSATAIGKELGCTGSLVCSRLHEIGIPVKAGNALGEENANWKGGISFEPYGLEFNDKLKKAIRKRDNYTCAISGEPGRFVHHINYDKTDNRPENLITLNASCHSKTNHNRDWWQAILGPIAQLKENHEISCV